MFKSCGEGFKSDGSPTSLMCIRLQQDSSNSNTNFRGLPKSLQGHRPAKPPAGVPTVLLSSIDLSFEYGLCVGDQPPEEESCSNQGIFDTSDFERELDDLEQGESCAQEIYRLFGVAFQSIITPSTMKATSSKSLAELAPIVFSLKYKDVNPWYIYKIIVKKSLTHDKKKKKKKIRQWKAVQD